MGHLDERVPGIAAAQIGLLAGVGVLPRELGELEVPPEGTPVHDLDGGVLFERVRLNNRMYVDLAVAPEFGAPLIAVTGAGWNPEALVKQAAASLKRRNRRASFDEARFVAYSFPKIAVQFLQDGDEVALIECYTGQPVPEEPLDDNFKRISFRTELDRAVARRRTKRFGETLRAAPAELRRLNQWSNIVPNRNRIESLLKKHAARDLHYSHRADDHEVCYELRGQETNVWCVGASVQMLLDFYRYAYTQDRLATELGLGTKDNPNGLPYSRVGDVVLVLESLSTKALNAAINMTPIFTEFKTEIQANRPLISVIPGHCRTVAGFTQTTSLIPGLSFQGLLVYDPWPPDAGVITRWENFAATTYYCTYTARVTLA